MTLLPELAEIGPDALTRPFWDACRRHELRLQRCGACGRFRNPPLPGCPACGSAESDWPRLSGRGRVFSYTIVHHPAMPSLQGSVPYNVVVIEPDDAPEARVISNLLDVAPEDVQVGLAVEVAWDDVREDLTLPRFRLAGAA